MVNSGKLKAFTLAELLVVLVILGILILIALPNLMPLISEAKSLEAQKGLEAIHMFEKTYFMKYSKYSGDLKEIKFEANKTVQEGGNANYRFEIIEASSKGFKAKAAAVNDFDGDGILNLWIIDQDKKFKGGNSGLMALLFFIPFLLSLVILFVEDLKHRQVSVIWILIFGISSIGVSLTNWNYKFFLFNLAFLIVNMVVISIFYFIKEKRMFSVIDHKIGLGDLIVLAITASLFSPGNYILFVIVTCILGVFSSVILSKKHLHIPLVSVMGVILFFLTAYSLPDLSISSWKNDNWLLGIF